MKRLSFLSHAAVALLLGTPALADKFHFSKPDAEEMQARVIEGVLLEETEQNYVIRVEGGQITVPKSLVTKVEKDGLTVAKLETRENDSREALAEANQRRLAAQRAAETTRESMRQTARAEEASASRAATSAAPTYVNVIDAPGLLGGSVYDPVIGRSLVFESIVEQEIRREFGGIIRREAQRELRRLRRELRYNLRYR